MYIAREATLDDWEGLKYLSSSVFSKAPHYEFYANAIKQVDLTLPTLQNYLLNSLTKPDFKLFLLTIPTGTDYVQGYVAVAVQLMPDFKAPNKIDRVGFIPAMFSNKVGTEGTKYLVDKMVEFGEQVFLKYFYANVRTTGAFSHFLEHYGAEEISRTLFVETEKLKNE